MLKPHKDNELIKNAIAVWNVNGYIFVLISNVYVNEDDYIVKVWPHDDRESFWSYNGPWETQSGAAWTILNYLDEGNE